MTTTCSLNSFKRCLLASEMKGTSQMPSGMKHASFRGGKAKRMPAISDEKMISTVWPRIAHPGERSVPAVTDPRLNIFVVFTSVDATKAALRTAGRMADYLEGRITLLVPETVPWPLPLNKPPVLHRWKQRQFRALAAQSSVPAEIRFYLCRDWYETLSRILKPHSLLVIGGKKRWWPTSEGRLAARLRKLGHEVILTEAD